MASWHLVAIRFQKQDEAGSLKTINEKYLIDAISYTEAEAIGYKKIQTGASDFSVKAITKMRLADLFSYEDGEKWFKAKVVYYSVEERSGKEKKVVNYMLVNADGIDQALQRITESMRNMLIPYETTDINLTQILDVIHYTAIENPETLYPAAGGYVEGETWGINGKVFKCVQTREPGEVYQLEDWELLPE